MKTCPLCNQPIQDQNTVVAVMAGRYIDLKNGKYELQVTRQNILSHMVCPIPEQVVEAQVVEEPK